MANFGLARLLVKPRDGWPNIHAQRSASGADRILETTALFDSLEAAIADCTVVLATTRPRSGEARARPGRGGRVPRAARRRR